MRDASRPGCGLTVVAALLAGTVTPPALAAVLKVGPGQTYTKPCAAIAAAAAGDIIEIDAKGSYAGDVCSWTTKGLTLRGVGGRAKIDAAGQNAAGKGIWVVGGDKTVVENIEFSGATVPDENGAGIRLEPSCSLTVRNCYFHDNENGILGGSGSAELLIESSEFYNNGFGDGYTHNLYVSGAKLTFRFNYSHHSKIGHLLKSRAAANFILYNRFTEEAGGTGSYEIDLPDGGTSYVIGNLVQQGEDTDNPTLLAYGEESAKNAGRDLYVVNNTFVNDRKAGGTFVVVGGSITVPAIIKNNLFVGVGTPTNQASAVLAGNFSGDPKLVDAASYDYHLQAGSPAIDAGVDPGQGGGFSLLPTFQYLHPASAQARPSDGKLDVGAYEHGVAPPLAEAGAVPRDRGHPAEAGSPGGDRAADRGGHPGDATIGERGSLAKDSGCSCELGGTPVGDLALLFLLGLPLLRRIFFSFGGGGTGPFAYALDTNQHVSPDWKTTGSIITTKGKLGVDYDERTQQLVAWAGGAPCALDMNSKAWACKSSKGAPLAQVQNGTYGRWRYLSRYNVFMLVNQPEQNVFFYKHSAGCGSWCSSWPASVPAG